MPATAAAMVRQQKRMRICLQARSNTLTLRGNLRFSQTMPADGKLQFTLPDVLKAPPISQGGNVNEIIGKSGGADEPRNAANQLQTLLYAA
jgi:hypothetical protein